MTRPCPYGSNHCLMTGPEEASESEGQRPHHTGAGVLILDYPTSRTGRNKLPIFINDSMFGILLQHHELTQSSLILVSLSRAREVIGW